MYRASINIYRETIRVDPVYLVPCLAPEFREPVRSLLVPGSSTRTFSWESLDLAGREDSEASVDLLMILR